MLSQSGKEVLLGVLTVCVGIFNAYLWRGILFEGAFRDVTFYSIPVLALFLFGVFFSLSSAFIQKSVIRIPAVILAHIGGFLMIPATTVAVSALPFVALGAWYGSHQIRSALKNASHFGVRVVFGPGLPMFFTVIAFALTIFYFSSLGGNVNIFVPKVLFNAALPIVEKPLGNIFPGFQRKASVDELILSFILNEQGEKIDLNTLPPEEREKFLQEARQAFARQFNVEIKGDERGSDVLYEVTNAQIEKFVADYRQLLPFIAAIGFFVAVKALTLPISWITLLLLYFGVKLLLLMGFLQKKTEEVEVERLGL